MEDEHEVSKLVLIAAVSLAAAGCTPDWASRNETGFIMEIASIWGASATGDFR